MVDYFLMYNYLNIKICLIKVKFTKNKKFFCFLSFLCFKKFYNIFYENIYNFYIFVSRKIDFYIFWN